MTTTGVFTWSVSNGVTCFIGALCVADTVDSMACTGHLRLVAVARLSVTFSLAFSCTSLFSFVLFWKFCLLFNCEKYHNSLSPILNADRTNELKRMTEFCHKSMETVLDSFVINNLLPSLLDCSRTAIYWHLVPFYFAI